MTSVAAKEKNIQEMVDMVFSFGELGFQEVETSRYLTGILRKNGFKVDTGIAAPGHGEGHNSGQSVIIFAALAVKELSDG